MISWGGSSFFIRYKLVSRVCAILSRFKADSYLRGVLKRKVQGRIVLLISLSLVFIFCHLFSHSRSVSYLMTFFRSEYVKRFDMVLGNNIIPNAVKLRRNSKVANNFYHRSRYTNNIC